MDRTTAIKQYSIDKNLSNANLRHCDLRFLCLRDANLWGADLRGADLSHSDLRGADLSDADLRDADLSGVIGLLSPSQYMKENFERVEDGFIAYKRFSTDYPAPENWIIVAGSIISEVVNPIPTIDCGCGINVSTLEWQKRQAYTEEVWKVLIPFGTYFVVPYNTDGKIRVEQVKLLEIVEV
jgi:hypothetical protein